MANISPKHLGGQHGKDGKNSSVAAGNLNGESDRVQREPEVVVSDGSCHVIHDICAFAKMDDGSRNGSLTRAQGKT